MAPAASESLIDMRPSRPPQRLRIWLFAAIAAVALPLSAFSLRQGLTRHDAELRGASAAASARATALAAETGEFFGGVHDLLRALRAMPKVQEAATDSRGCDVAIEQVRRELAQYSSILVTSAQGAVICASPAAPRTTYVSDRAWFQRAIRNNGFAIGDPVFGRVSGQQTIHVAAPMRDHRQRITGVSRSAWISNGSTGALLRSPRGPMS